MHKKTIVITSGYFNPIHPWHIECFDLCKTLGDELRVIVNSDLQAQLKTGSMDLFQDQEVRMKIVAAIKSVDYVMLSVDTDSSVVASIQKIHDLIKERHGPETHIIFWKGGDRFSGNIPEVSICHELGIEIKDWLWAKIDHSSIYRAKRI